MLVALIYGFRPQPVAVDTALAQHASLQVTLREEGRTRVRDRYVVATPIAGYVRRIALEVGDVVSVGQALAALEPLRTPTMDARSRAETEARVAAAAAALRAAREHVRAATASAELATAEVERVRRLRTRQLASADELDRAVAAARRTQADLQSAQFSVQVAMHERSALQAALKISAGTPASAAEQVTITAPAEGRVLKVQRKSEGVVAAGAPLLEVGDPRRLEVEVDVLSVDAVRITPGTRVRLERWGGKQDLDAVVRHVEPVGFTKISALGVEEQRVWVIVDITAPRDAWLGLGDAYRVEARFILWESDDVLQIPTSALFRIDGGWAVFVVEGGKAHRREVEVGQRSGLRGQIVAGLAAGETVIVHPDDKIETGARVETRTR